MATIGKLLIFVHAVTKQIEVRPVVPVDGLKQAAVYLRQKLHHLQAKIKKNKDNFTKITYTAASFIIRSFVKAPIISTQFSCETFFFRG
jgi:hypothetical protein